MATIAVISFPGSNNEVESLRVIKKAGMDAVFFRWNDDTAQLSNCDGYFLPGGFSYEDRGRSGMVAAQDKLFQFLHEEAEKGKVIIGNCNGCQMLVESGLVPLGDQLQMCMAHNIVDGEAIGFHNEWIWITPTCGRDRCATSDWDGAMHVPIAHGEGRFITKDADLIEELRKNDQIAFSYCDKDGYASSEAPVTPNGSMLGIAGICNPPGNVVALMPHPERSSNGLPYFVSIKNWIEKNPTIENRLSAGKVGEPKKLQNSTHQIPSTIQQASVEVFIDTKITNNEERTVEQAGKKYVPNLKLKQMRYYGLSQDDPSAVLSHISLFNTNKHAAYIRRGKTLTQWNPDTKSEEGTDAAVLQGLRMLRRDEPDTGIRDGIAMTGICYVCSGIDDTDLERAEVQHIFANPHASSLQLLQ